MLPKRPARAAVSGLALYDATYWHKRFAVWTGRILLRLQGDRALRLRYSPHCPEPNGGGPGCPRWPSRPVRAVDSGEEAGQGLTVGKSYTSGCPSALSR